MTIFDKFSPAHFVPNPSLMASVSEHRNRVGMVPIIRIKKQILKTSTKTVYPAGWRFK